jgi:hypothetical protein
MQHFIRGYFDGDGCAYLYKPSDQNLQRLRITFCGTEKFLNSLNDILHNNIGTSDNKLIDMNKYGNNVFNLRYVDNDSIYKLFDYMYKDATIYLKRKKEKFDIFMNERI